MDRPGFYGAMGESREVRAYLFTHYPYTPYCWTLEQLVEARTACGVSPYTLPEEAEYKGKHRG